MKHIVKCKICGESFDRDSVKTTKWGTTRYCHYECYPQGELVNSPNLKSKEEVELEKYILQKFGIEKYSQKIKKQLKQYTEEYNYSYRGIYLSLFWWFEINGNTIEKANGGIGIVPYIYEDARAYFATISKIQNAVTNIQLQGTTEDIYIKSPSIRQNTKNIIELK